MYDMYTILNLQEDSLHVLLKMLLFYFFILSSSCGHECQVILLQLFMIIVIYDSFEAFFIAKYTSHKPVVQC